LYAKIRARGHSALVKNLLAQDEDVGIEHFNWFAIVAEQTLHDLVRFFQR
jgi:hypothetical protein